MSWVPILYRQKDPSGVTMVAICVKYHYVKRAQVFHSSVADRSYGSAGNYELRLVKAPLSFTRAKSGSASQRLKGNISIRSSPPSYNFDWPGHLVSYKAAHWWTIRFCAARVDS